VFDLGNSKSGDLEVERLGVSGSETGILKPVNDAVNGAHNAVRLSSASLVERTVCNGRLTVRQPVTCASVNDRRAEKSQAL
jgi:hypothetical protein